MLRTTEPFGISQAVVEANRCLGCYQAPCTQACPAGVDIPGFIRRFREDNLAGASELIYQACPLGSTCGNACPTTELCEGACVLAKMGQTPIRIGSLQAAITNACPAPETAGNPSLGYRVAVVGAGPAGLGCAVQLNRAGISVDVFDRDSRPGGMVNRVIPAHRLPNSAIEVDLNRLKGSGIQFMYGKSFDSSTAQTLLSSYDAVFLGLGLSDQNQSNLAGTNTRGVYSALDILAQARQAANGEAPFPSLGNRVIVVGGGNVALDAAVVARRQGAQQVTVLYRRSKAEMPGWESEYLEACALGVEFRWLSVVDEIITKEGNLSGVKVGSMRFVQEQANGRRWVEPDPDVSSYTLQCDSLIFALGQTLEQESLTVFGLTPTKTVIPVRKESSHTEVSGIFAAGEAVSGGSTIVACMSAGMAAGREIVQWLQAIKANGGLNG